MNVLSMQQAAQVGGGNLVVGTIALVAVGAWIWSNREALNDIAESAAATAADLDAECGG
ncbi:hypothetical protein [Arenimonas sp. MALMAid1274]|uniref:hypothetical protein n=1 Tax=Arenimonas sp. MALMAid1274 TaxID=3411630 RepID=UPI003B9F89B0